MKGNLLVWVFHRFFQAESSNEHKTRSLMNIRVSLCAKVSHSAPQQACYLLWELSRCPAAAPDLLCFPPLPSPGSSGQKVQGQGQGQFSGQAAPLGAPAVLRNSTLDCRQVEHGSEAKRKKRAWFMYLTHVVHSIIADVQFLVAPLFENFCYCRPFNVLVLCLSLPLCNATESSFFMLWQTVSFLLYIMIGHISVDSSCLVFHHGSHTISLLISRAREFCLIHIVHDIIVDILCLWIPLDTHGSRYHCWYPPAL